MTLTNNYAHAIMKQKKIKTDYLRGLSVFVFIVKKLGPFEKPFHKLGLHQDFQTLENNFSFLVFGNPDETLALVYEILLLKTLIIQQVITKEIISVTVVWKSDLN